MTVVASYVYKSGKRLREAPLTPQGLAMQAGEFVWIGLFEPTDAEMQVLVERFNLHPLAVEDSLTAHQLPKLEVYGSCLFLVARTAREQDDQIIYGETHVFVGSDYIITIRHGSARGHTQLRHQLETAPALLKHGPDLILHGVLDFIVDGYLPVIDAIEDRVLGLEQTTLDRFLSREDIKALFHLRRELLRFSRLLGPMEDLSGKLGSLDLPGIDKDVRPYFRDVTDHVRRVSSRAGALRDVLSSVFDVSSLLEQQRQGIITRKLAAWAAILATPTAIAGIYGMNFRHMPELNWTWGYPGALGLMLAVCAGLYLGFKRTGWL